jgi:hypothetical protein
MAVRPRSLLAAFAVLAAVLAAAYSAYWLHVAGAVRDGIAAWSERSRAQGWTVDYAGPEIGGFPFRLSATLAEPHLTSPSGFDWRGERLIARASPFDLLHIDVDLAGRHQLALTASPQLRLAGTISAEAARLKLHFYPRGGLDDATLIARHVVAAPDKGEPIAIASLAVTLDPQGTVAPKFDTPTVIFIAAAEGIDLPELPGLTLERHITVLDLKARVLGPIPDKAPLPALAEWSRDGGSVEIDHLAMDWPPLALEAEGTIAFDPRLQPLASMTARVRGYGEFVDRLARTGVMAAGQASAAKLVLGMMAKPDAHGRPALPVPLTLQDGSLSIGPAKVATVPPLPFGVLP